MAKPTNLIIDTAEREGKTFYSFKIAFEYGIKHESCFCYESFERAFYRAMQLIVRENT